MLKPQDICVLLKIVAVGPSPWSYSQLAYELGMSASEVHAGVRRAADAGLLRVDEGWGIPQPLALDELLVHGVRYVWPAEHLGPALGVTTGAWAAPLQGRFTDLTEPPLVWPDPQGEVRGSGVVPLYKSVPVAVKRDARLYELLALVDAIRLGPAAVRTVAVQELRIRLGTEQVASLSQSAAGSHRRNTTLTSRDYYGEKRQRVHRGRH